MRLSHGHTRPYDDVRLPVMGKFWGIGDHRATLHDVSENREASHDVLVGLVMSKNERHRMAFSCDSRATFYDILRRSRVKFDIS